MTTHPNSSSHRLLVVEDEKELRELIVLCFQGENIEIDTAANGLAALSKLEHNSYDAILSDLRMPEKSGFDLLTEIKQKNIHTPVVIISAFADKPTLLSALRLGALDFIEKPFDRAELITVVFRAIEIGVRRKAVHDALASAPEAIVTKIANDEKMANLVQISNSKRRN